MKTLVRLYSWYLFQQEIEVRERSRKEEQEFDELVSFIQQRLTQTEVGCLLLQLVLYIFIVVTLEGLCFEAKMLTSRNMSFSPSR